MMEIPDGVEDRRLEVLASESQRRERGGEVLRSEERRVGKEC